MNETRIYRIETRFACGAVTVEGKVKRIIKEGTAPIFKKFIGKTLPRLQKWLLNKTGEVNTQEL